MSATDGKAPKVFVSSTNLDLDAYRKEAVMAANAAGCLADVQENWTAEDHPPLDACLQRVGKADVLVVIVAHRYGWVPEDRKHNPEGKSITWLECEEAVTNGKHVLAFVVDDDADWPAERKDDAALKRAMEEDDDEKAAELMRETRRRSKRLKAFKAWLSSRGLRRTYRTKEELKLEVERALIAWRPKAAAPKTSGPQTPPRQEIPSGYREWLERECADLTFSSSLKIQQGQALRLTHLYVPVVVGVQGREPGRPWTRSGFKKPFRGAERVKSCLRSCWKGSGGTPSTSPVIRVPASPCSAAGPHWPPSWARCRISRWKPRKATARPCPTRCEDACPSSGEISIRGLAVIVAGFCTLYVGLAIGFPLIGHATRKGFDPFTTGTRGSSRWSPSSAVRTPISLSKAVFPLPSLTAWIEEKSPG